jgi:magnesium transporter
VLDIDSLAMAEVHNTEARPRVIEYDNCTLISLKMLRLDIKTGKTLVENLSLVLTTNVIIAFQERKGDGFEPIREGIRKGGIDYLTFSMLDIVVDNYLHVISIYQGKI